ncbi:MAG: aldehyde ferredoxin oxidoreductase C-terminal domain-containing protein [Anaerolineae bacterium]|jgi:aldehyde:ferredoxin oxidoreductase
MAKILRVNMTDRTAAYEEVPEKYQHLAGRGLTSTMIYDEVDPTCHPLGPNNKLVFAPGLMTGTVAPTSGRVSVGGKSPLTGTIKESNAGTKWPQQLAKLGIKAIVVEGRPEEEGWWGLHITKDGVEFFDADEYTDQGLYDMAPSIFERFGDRVGMMTIGVAGEKKMAMAGICFNDMKNRPSRYSGRGGLGAVAGSKGLKFIIVDDTDAPGVDIADKDLFDQGRKKLLDALRTHDITKPKGTLNTYGTAALVNVINEAGAYPTRNFRQGRFEGAATTSGEAIFEGNQKRLGKELYNHACHPGCVIQCSNTWFDEEGDEMVSCVEYESTWALGANCGIDDLDAVAELIWLSNDLGIDTIEAGDVIGVAMDSGLAEFGDSEAAIKWLDEDIRQGTPLGHILGQGTEFTANAFGNERSPTIKGQGMPAYEPRAIKGIGMTYAISTMGADHTSGYTIAPEILAVGGSVDQFDVDKADLVRAFQQTTAFIDMSGHCLFIAFAILDIPEGFEGLVEESNGVLGTDWTGDDVTRIGQEILDKELAFNRAAGFTEADDRMPEFMLYEKLPPHDVTWDVPNETLDAVFGEA